MRSDGIKWMDLDEFLNEGFLQEANRQFFHPLGLALAVTCDDSGKVTGITGLWDYRKDPEGMVFGDEIDPEKARKVFDERRRHYNERSRMFGQPEVTMNINDVQPLHWRPDDGPPRNK